MWRGVAFTQLTAPRSAQSWPRAGLSWRVPAPRMGEDNINAIPVSNSAFGAETITLTPGSATFLVGALIKRDRYKTLQNSWTVDDSLDELQRLGETADLEILGREYQTMQHPSASTFIGPGKLAEIAATVESMRIKTVIFDDELSPGQERNIQAAFGRDVQIIDRTMLILFIFAQRARTREAKLQVAAAQMKYMLPRLTTFLTTGAGMDAKGGGGAGGTGTEGGGDSEQSGATSMHPSGQELSSCHMSIPGKSIHARRHGSSLSRHSRHVPAGPS